MQYINQTSRCPGNAYKGLTCSKVHGGNPEGQLHWSQNAVYQSNFQMSRQCLQRSDMFYLTLQRFTVSTYIGGGLQSEDFQTFYA